MSRRAGWLGVGLLLLPAYAPAAPVVRRGDVAFPLEVWGVVCRWHVGSAARSAREGWVLREIKDAAWPKVAAGRTLPKAPEGAWLRSAFVIRPKEWRQPELFLDGLPGGSRIFLNGVPIVPGGVSATVALGAELRAGTNLLVVVTPPDGGTPFLAPRGTVSGTLRRTGKTRVASAFRTWKVRVEQIEPGIPETWIRSPDPTVWRMKAARPPDPGDAILHSAAACWKAALEFPAMWRGRPVAAYLHALPGAPDVWLNGTRIATNVRTPARLDLAGHLKFNGRDTLCLVYASLPPAGSPGDGQRALVALRWDAAQPVPAFPSGTPWRLEAPPGPAADGARAALVYAAEILSLSSSPYEFRWSDGAPAGDPAGAPRAAEPGLQAIIAGWGGTGFRSSELTASRDSVARRLESLEAAGAPRWIMAHPSVGRNRLGAVNERLMIHNRHLRRIAGERGARFLPVFEVTRSALKRAKRGPVQPEFVTDAGAWTPAGSFVAALALLDALSLP